MTIQADARSSACFVSKAVLDEVIADFDRGFAPHKWTKAAVDDNGLTLLGELTNGSYPIQRTDSRWECGDDSYSSRVTVELLICLGFGDRATIEDRILKESCSHFIKSAV